MSQNDTVSICSRRAKQRLENERKKDSGHIKGNVSTCEQGRLGQQPAFGTKSTLTADHMNSTWENEVGFSEGRGTIGEWKRKAVREIKKQSPHTQRVKK